MTRALVASIIIEVLQLAAVASISYGAWLAYEPAGFITGGLLVLAGTIIPAKG